MFYKLIQPKFSRKPDRMYLLKTFAFNLYNMPIINIQRKSKIYARIGLLHFTAMMYTGR